MAMTEREKDAIRNAPCGRCGAKPPFHDGSRCQVHRLVPSRGYVPDNVVSRCPGCHASEPNHPVLPKTAHAAGKKGGALGGALGGTRTYELHPEVARENLRRYREEHPEEAHAHSIKHASQGAIALNAKLTPEQRAANIAKAAPLGGHAVRAKYTDEEYAAIRRKGWETRRAKKNQGGAA